MSIKVEIETKDFFEQVLPALRAKGYLTGTIYPVEGVDEKFLRMLDFHSFDYILETDEDLLEGISVRICNGTWDTFTVRRWTQGVEYDTEYQKHKIAMEKDRIRPYWHVQAYKVNSEIVSVALCVKDNLISYISDGNRYTVRGIKETFYSIDWADYERSGYPIVVLRLRRKEEKD